MCKITDKVKVKVKVSRYTPWRRLGGEEVQLLLILNLGTGWGWVVVITLRPRFTPGKGPLVPIVQEAGWAPEPVWTQRLEEKSSASVGDWTPIVQSVVTILTELPRLLKLPIQKHNPESHGRVVCIPTVFGRPLARNCGRRPAMLTDILCCFS
jgi:hypothetical protein